DEPVTGPDLGVWHLGRQFRDTAVGAFQPQLGRLPFQSAGEAPGPVAMSLTLDRCAAVGEIHELPHGAKTASPLASTAYVLSQFVAGDAQGQVGFDVLNRVVAGVGV